MEPERENCVYSRGWGEWWNNLSLLSITQAMVGICEFMHAKHRIALSTECVTPASDVSWPYVAQRTLSCDRGQELAMNKFGRKLAGEKQILNSHPFGSLQSTFAFVVLILFYRQCLLCGQKYADTQIPHVGEHTSV